MFIWVVGIKSSIQPRDKLTYQHLSSNDVGVKFPSSLSDNSEQIESYNSSLKKQPVTLRPIQTWHCDSPLYEEPESNQWKTQFSHWKAYRAQSYGPSRADPPLERKTLWNAQASGSHCKMGPLSGMKAIKIHVGCSKFQFFIREAREAHLWLSPEEKDREILWGKDGDVTFSSWYSL